MDNITQARHNFVLAFQYCWNGEKFPIFREISVSELENIHTGYCAIDLLDEALNLHPDFQEARDLRSEIWHTILVNKRQDNYGKYLKSKAWAETRERFFEQAGRQCSGKVCGDTATQVHHKNYDNIGKENLLDLEGLCDDCHNELADRKEIARKVAELRINAAESKPLAWKKIREKLGLKNDEFHKVIRIEGYFRESMVERIESFEDGWEYGGKLKVLLGFEPVGELANRIEACKAKPAPKEEIPEET